MNARAVNAYVKMGQPRPLFIYFHSFQTQSVQKKLWDSAGFELELML